MSTVGPEYSRRCGIDSMNATGFGSAVSPSSDLSLNSLSVEYCLCILSTTIQVCWIDIQEWLCSKFRVRLLLGQKHNSFADKTRSCCWPLDETYRNYETCVCFQVL